MIESREFAFSLPKPLDCSRKFRRKDLHGANRAVSKKGLSDAGGTAGDGNHGLRTLRMLGALLLSAELPPLRPCSIRLGSSRSVHRDRLPHLSAKLRPRLSALLHGAPRSPERILSSLPTVAGCRADDELLCHVSSTARRVPEHPVRALSLARHRFVMLASWKRPT